MRFQTSPHLSADVLVGPEYMEVVDGDAAWPADLRGGSPDEAIWGPLKAT